MSGNVCLLGTALHPLLTGVLIPQLPFPSVGSVWGTRAALSPSLPGGVKLSCLHSWLSSFSPLLYQCSFSSLLNKLVGLESVSEIASGELKLRQHMVIIQIMIYSLYCIRWVLILQMGISGEGKDAVCVSDTQTGLVTSSKVHGKVDLCSAWTKVSFSRDLSSF